MSPSPDHPEDRDGGFLSRWSRRKTAARQGLVPAEPAPPAASPVTPPVAPPVARPTPVVRPATQADVAGTTSHQSAGARPATEPAPTLADVARLDPQAADFSRFVARHVVSEVRNAALKKLFSDPHFNVMDGLDTYIDDYSQPDPLPPGMLEQLRHTDLLGLKTPEPDAEPATAPETTATAATAATTEPAGAPGQPEPAAAPPSVTDGEQPAPTPAGLPDPTR